MHKTEKILAIIACLFVVYACGLREDLQVLIEETGEFKNSLQDEHGIQPTVSTQLSNGRLFVFVTLNVNKLGELTMKEVHDILHEEAEEAFTEEIYQLTITAGD